MSMDVTSNLGSVDLAIARASSIRDLAPRETSVDSSNGANADVRIPNSPAPAQGASLSANAAAVAQQAALPGQGATNGAADVSQANTAIRPEQVKEAAVMMNDFLQSLEAKVQVTYNEKAGMVVVRLVDAKDPTKVVKEIPPKEMIELAEKMKDFVGVLLDKKA